MNQKQPVKLTDYRPPNYLVESICLTFHLDDSATLVQSKIKFYRQGSESLFELYGHKLDLRTIYLNGQPLDSSRYQLDAQKLQLFDMPEQGELKIENVINPAENKTLEGLYKSGDIFCTQCEPEGFRAITFYPDRPDVMTKFTTTIIADKSLYPVLLSNGNPIERGELEGGKHFVTWEDPFAKPSYLFALVAGDLGVVRDFYTTSISGRKIALEIYCDKGNEDKCHHALESLKHAMRWDEERFGLEYDLDIYMIVAVDSFNMGAMENKGLNIFNSKYVLAKQETATDKDFLGIEGVIGHEYFHNWTGNRVTCKNWFQLTLKEGLTVYRDQEFSADMMQDYAVKRIDDVVGLRSAQFVEDAGPTAHPIKPKEYIEMNNFYTATVYEKGAEVIRMIETFLGRDGFRRGMDLYFERHDGQAVTTEDFVAAMSDANNHYDFSQFEKSWYNRAGTPHLYISSEYNQEAQTLIVSVRQECIETPGVESTPFHLPLKIGLVAADGTDIELNLDQAEGQLQLNEGILHIREEEERFIFKNVNEQPVLSLNRGFRAPVIIHYDYSLEDLAFLSANDQDDFNRYEAMQTLCRRLVCEMMEQKESDWKLSAAFKQAFAGILKSDLKPAIKSYCLQLPSIALLKLEFNQIDIHKLVHARKFISRSLAEEFCSELEQLYWQNCTQQPFSIDAKSIGQRRLKNSALSYLSELPIGEELLLKQWETANNMTDELAVLMLISDSHFSSRQLVIDQFIERWKDDKLVVDKWFSALALANRDDSLEVISKLLDHPLFDFTNPNSVRAVIGAFIANSAQFHRVDGAGYNMVVEQIIKLDKINPQLSASLVMGFRDYQKLIPSLQQKMTVALEKLERGEEMSDNLRELLTKLKPS